MGKRIRAWLKQRHFQPERDYANSPGFKAMEKARILPHLNPNIIRCVAIARNSGERCKCPAVTGAKCCRFHGGLQWAFKAAKEANPRVEMAVRPQTIKKRFEASVAFSDVLNECGIEIPRKVMLNLSKSHIGARGRKIEEFLNTGRIKEDE
jgi:hypothetical protein